MPIILALVMNSIPGKRFKRVAQTITYLPHFISVVVLVGLMSCMFSVNSGWFSTIVRALGGTPVQLMGEAKYFRHVYVWSGVWQQMGWNSIIYLAALTSIDPGLHEAAMIDGCNPIQIFFKVVFPILKPTMISTAILETMWVWNDYLLPTLVLDIKKYRTIPMAIQYFRGGYGRVELAPMMACIIIAIIPIIILYMTCQKYIIEGVVAGAVKG